MRQLYKKFSIKSLTYVLIMFISLLAIDTGAFAETNTVEPPYFSSELKIHEQMKTKGYNKSYVYINNDEVLMRFEVDEIDSGLPMEMIELISTGYGVFTLSKRITVEAYHEQKPFFGISAKTADVSEYINNNIDLDEFFDRIELNDLRSTEDNIKADLLPLDVYIHEVDVDMRSAQIVVSYMGKEEKQMLEDYVSMLTVLLRNAPWVDKAVVRFSFEQGKGEVSISSSTVDILDLLDGNITEEVFFNRIRTDVKTYKPYSESQRFIGKAIYNIRSMPWGNTILIVIIALFVLFVIRIIYKIFRRVRKKR